MFLEHCFFWNRKDSFTFLFLGFCKQFCEAENIFESVCLLVAGKHPNSVWFLISKWVTSLFKKGWVGVLSCHLWRQTYNVSQRSPCRRENQPGGWLPPAYFASSQFCKEGFLNDVNVFYHEKTLLLHQNPLSLQLKQFYDFLPQKPHS